MSSNRNMIVMRTAPIGGKGAVMASAVPTFRRCGSAPMLVRLIAWALRG